MVRVDLAALSTVREPFWRTERGRQWSFVIRSLLEQGVLLICDSMSCKTSIIRLTTARGVREAKNGER